MLTEHEARWFAEGRVASEERDNELRIKNMEGLDFDAKCRVLTALRQEHDANRESRLRIYSREIMRRFNDATERQGHRRW